nr:MAG TPA: hypothetical protein [Caudoviricetes sp.]
MAPITTLRQENTQCYRSRCSSSKKTDDLISTVDMLYNNTNA